MKSLIRRYSLLVALLAAWAPPAFSQNPARIERIEIQHVGPQAVSDDLIRSHIRVRVGDNYSRSAVDEDVRTLYSTGYFHNIRVVEDLSDSGAKLRYVVQGKPILTDVKFEGNKKMSTSKLQKKISSKVGDPLDERKLFADAQELKSLYQKSGYQKTDVKYTMKINENAGRGTAVFDIKEAPKVKIASVDFVGAEAFPQKDLRKELKTTPNRDDAVLKVVREAFKLTKAVRFEGNGYSDEWVKEAKKRGLPNYRRSPEALLQIVSKQSVHLFTTLGILTKEEVDSRYHIRLERYIKDIMIEMYTLAEMVDTLVLPSSLAYLGSLADSAAKAKSAGIKIVPQRAAAEAVGKRVVALQKAAAALHAAIQKAETLHHDPAKQAQFLTSTGADSMAAVRAQSDALELTVGDDFWPLPRYREMLFPV